MRSLVVVTQKVDPDDPNLAAVVPMLAALARRVDRLAVLALAAAPADLPANVRVRTFGAPTRLGRGLRFAAALAGELRRRPDALIAHMSPVYAVLAAPLARALQVRVLLWFTHWRPSRLLALAERASHAVVSVDERSFPLPSRKLVAIGHGIDPGEFPCADRAADGGLRLLVLGRYSPAKGLDHVLRGLRLALDAGVDVSLIARGPTVTEEERRHRDALERLTAQLGLGSRALLDGPVPRSQVPALLAEADALVNNMRAGALDKVVFEAAASCLPVLASNPGFDALLGGLELRLAFARERPEELAERIGGLAAAGEQDRMRVGRRLRERVVAGHSVETWADGILRAAER